MRKLATLLAFLSWASFAFAQGVDPVVQSFDVFPGADGGQQMVRLEATQVFWDDFGTGTLDTTNRWNTPTTGGGGNAVAATNAVGLTVLSSGTSANGYSLLTTQPTFPGRNPGYLTGQWQTNLPSPVPTGAYAAWGWFSNPGTPTAAAPLTNAVVFAVDTSGKLRAQTWASGTINQNIDLSVQITTPDSCNCVPQPTDSAAHKYQITFRGDNILWWIDGRLVARVLTGAGGPDVNTLAVGALTVVGTSGISSALTVQLNQVTIGDSSRNNVRLCDSTFNFRCQTVTSSGGTATASIGSAALATSQISITSSATQVVAARTGAAGTGRKSVCVTNITGTSPVYLGSTTPITTSIGMFVPGSVGASICLDTQSIIYGISGGGTQTVSYSETF